jgi:hypothetical protein
MKSKKIFFYALILFFILFIHLVFPQEGGSDTGGQTGSDTGGPKPSNAITYLESSLSSICRDIQDMIPTASMLLVVLGSVIYGGAQLFGNAEIRARGSVWATSCITGAVLGLIIATIAPDILSQLAGTPISC